MQQHEDQPRDVRVRLARRQQRSKAQRQRGRDDARWWLLRRFLRLSLGTGQSPFEALLVSRPIRDYGRLIWGPIGAPSETEQLETRLEPFKFAKVGDRAKPI